MAWNRPSEDGRANTPGSPRRGRSPRPTVAVRGAVAGAIVVVGTAIAAWWLWPSQERGEDDASTKRGLIKEVAPKLTQVRQEKLDHPGMVKVRGKWYPEYNKAGGKIWISKDWVRYHSPVVYTNSASDRLSKAARIFTNYADRELADLITAPLGTVVIGEIKYGPVFVKQFLESCKEPILVSPDDDEWTANVKRSVKEAKIEIMSRYNKGEDIAQIMTDTRKSLQDLGVYKLELMKTMRESLNKARNDPEQTKDIYDAANMLLAERGIEPIKLPTLLKNKLKLNETKKEEKKE